MKATKEVQELLDMSETELKRIQKISDSEEICNYLDTIGLILDKSSYEDTSDGYFYWHCNFRIIDKEGLEKWCKEMEIEIYD